MRLGLLGFLVGATIAAAKLGEKKDIVQADPRTAGSMHTEALVQLGGLVGKEEMSREQLMEEVGKISASFCSDDDVLCASNAKKASLDEFERASHGNRIIEYPKDFDVEVRAQLNKMHRVLRDYDGSTYEEIMETLSQIQKDIEDMKDVDYSAQITGLAAVSVALESTELWTNAFSNEEHSFHRSLVKSTRNGERKLQSYEGVITADINATIAMTIEFIQDLGTGNPFLFLGIPPIILISVIQFAIPASVIAAFPNGTEGPLVDN